MNGPRLLKIINYILTQGAISVDKNMNKEIEVTELYDTDFPAYFEMMSDSVMAQKTGFEPVEDEQKAKMLFESENDTNKTYAIRLKDTHRLVGLINIFPEIGDNFEPDFENVELGYFINTSYQQRGYMTYALQWVLDQEMDGVSIVEATVDVNNIASQHLLLKLGFTQVDKYDDNLVYSQKLK